MVNNTILNRFFTQNVFFNTIHDNENAIYNATAQQYVENFKVKNNCTVISEVYKFMSRKYRNEYFYKNTLINKLLLGRHSVNTTTALTQIPINKSRADFILINGKAVVYEIKTELDSLERLDTQWRDYYKAFNHVCVVTSEIHYNKVVKVLKDTPVGVYVLTKQNSISLNLRKEPQVNNSDLDHSEIFRVLRKYEYEKILLKYYGKLPATSQVFFHGECLKWFSLIPIVDAYEMAIKELKCRNKITDGELREIPYELRSLVYFAKRPEKDWKMMNSFLSKKFGG